MKKFMISKLRMSGLSAAAVLITILAGCTEKQTVSPEIRPLDSEHVTVGPAASVNSTILLTIQENILWMSHCP